MLQEDIHQFLYDFFCATGCTVTKQGNGFLEVQLTEKMDEQLMNRPFYWHYTRKMNQQGVPMHVTWITDEALLDEKKGEYIHFGSPRLEQMFQLAIKLAPYVRFYEETPLPSALHPWLVLNVKITYQCDKVRQELLSLGLNLINGQFIDHFQEKVTTLSLTPKLPDQCFTISPLIRPLSGLNRCELYLQNYVQNQDDSWAIDATSRLNADLELLDAFYRDERQKDEQYEIEKKALIERYTPRITIQILNGGLLFLTPQTAQTKL